MSGPSEYKVLISYGELNNIYEKLNEVDTFDDEYLSLDYEHLQLTRVLLAFEKYLEDRNIEPQYKVDLGEEDE